MSLNDKPTYGTEPAVASGATKGSRRNLVVGLVRPRARKSIHGAFMSTESSSRARRHRRDVCSSQAAAACFALGVAAANVVPTQGLRGANPIGPNTTPKGFGPNGFDSGMSFPGMPDSAASTPGGGYKNNGY